jgi:hypothetical protein
VCAVEVATRGVRRARTAHPGSGGKPARTRDDRPPRRRGTVHTTIAYNGITIFSINATFPAHVAHAHTYRAPGATHAGL